MTTSVISSITRMGTIEPFELQVARGQIMGHRIVTVSGYNPDVDQTWVDIWSGTGTITYPAAALQMTVSSGSASDTAAGIGARTIRINGLDANYNEVSETVTLNGQTPVTTVNSYLRIQNALVTSAGSSNSAVGNIYIGSGTVTAGVPAVNYADIIVDFNSSLSNAYTIPAGYTGYLTYARFTAGQASGTTGVTARVRITGTNNIPLTIAVATLNNGVAELSIPYPNAIPEKTRISGMAIGASNNNAVSGYYQIVLIKNDLQAA